MVFPVIRSRLSSQAALTVVVDAYDSCDARTRSPLVRGLNVTYHVGTDAPSYTLRACRAHWRTTRYIHCKLELVCYLGERGAAVSTAISRRDHSLTASVVAPEDHRYNGLQPHHSPRRPRPRLGPCHGDATEHNAHLSDDGLVTLVDFDRGGPGWRAYELATFLMEARKHRQADTLWARICLDMPNTAR